MDGWTPGCHRSIDHNVSSTEYAGSQSSVVPGRQKCSQPAGQDNSDPAQTPPSTTFNSWSNRAKSVERHSSQKDAAALHQRDKKHDSSAAGCAVAGWTVLGALAAL
ncbi:hypothetical protein Y032_0024g886 [Ancylostoma ceylanicum]|uniref:Uncharacterized protein n=1 Tax=Ancylostoma ceylanicum TaxID=53326 RepID=A0A016UWA7_9BILA|nr:hypothetical protein Y032_0024g886 [Ancylostoma ceylanicum]